MKKNIAICIMICLCLVLVGCGKKKVTEKDATSVVTDNFKYDFEVDNNAYALSFLGMKKDDVVAMLGIANDVKEEEKYTRYDYGIFVLYANDSDGVFQIDSLDNINPINGFASKLNYAKLKESCSNIGMTVPEIKDNHKDKKDVKYSYNVKVKYDTWVISYTWDSKDKDIDYNTEDNTRIVIYKDGKQLWD